MGPDTQRPAFEELLDIFVKVYAHLTSLPRAEDQHVEKLARCNRQFFTALVGRLLNDLRPFVEVGKCYKQWNDRIVGKESSAEEVFRLGECFEINSNPCRRQRSIWIFGPSRQNLVCNAFRLLKISQRPVGSYEIIWMSSGAIAPCLGRSECLARARAPVMPQLYGHS